MGYDMAINDIKRLEKEEFTLDSLKFAGVIQRELDQILINEYTCGKVYAKHNYELLSSHLHDIIYEKLKAKIDFEDEVIEEIISLIKFSDRLEDICVLDGNVIAKVLSTAGFKPQYVTYLYTSTGFIDLANAAFNDVLKNTPVRDLIVNSLNTAIKPMIRNNKDNLDPVVLEGIEIKYGLPNIGIYLDKPLHLIKQFYQENKEGLIKVIAKVGEEDYYSFDMKVRDGMIILSQNDFELQKVSELLDSKKLTK